MLKALTMLPRASSSAGVDRARRAVLAGAAAVLAAMLAAPARAWNSTDVSGALPPLAFTMTRASDGKTVTAADFKGKVVLLFFGYTSCPDVCPTTLMNVSTMLKSLGKAADDIRVLFVTVDPNRDTLGVLKDYTGSFAPQIVGLRGTPDQLATLAKRYRVSYSVEPSAGGSGFDVTHGTAVYVFDRDGDVKLLFTGLALDKSDTAPEAADLRMLVAQSGGASWWRRLVGAL
jgi:protein SCO1/2